MDQVAPDLFVGTHADSAATQRLDEHHITTVVSLTHKSPEHSNQAIDIHSIPLIDGPKNDHDQFTKAVQQTVTAINQGECVLVHCSAGASRSPTVAATALALIEEIDLQNAIQQVADNRDAVDPHEALLRQAAHVYTELANSAAIS